MKEWWHLLERVQACLSFYALQGSFIFSLQVKRILKDNDGSQESVARDLLWLLPLLTYLEISNLALREFLSDH